MPELPEVHTVVEGLKQGLVSRAITGVLYCDSLKTIRSTTVEDFAKKIVGRSIVDVQRRAKNIFIYLSDGAIIHVHLKMTGHFLLVPRSYRIHQGRWQGDLLPDELRDPINQFIHVSIAIGDDMQLAFSDMRKFGYLHVVTAEQVRAVDAQHGPEPVGNPDFTLKIFTQLLEGTDRAIKAVLLDQTRIAGIGNIYGDEILFRAGIRPGRKVRSLGATEIRRIYGQIEPVLMQAIALRGTSIGDFRDTEGKKGIYQESRLVYGRERQPCLVCGTAIERIKIGQRSAYFCPHCQR